MPNVMQTPLLELASYNELEETLIKRGTLIDCNIDNPSFVNLESLSVNGLLTVGTIRGNGATFETLQTIVTETNNLYAQVAYLQSIEGGTIQADQIKSATMETNNAIIHNLRLFSAIVNEISVQKLYTDQLTLGSSSIQVVNGKLCINGAPYATMEDLKSIQPKPAPKPKPDPISYESYTYYLERDERLLLYNEHLQFEQAYFDLYDSQMFGRMRSEDVARACSRVYNYYVEHYESKPSFEECLKQGWVRPFGNYVMYITYSSIAKLIKKHLPPVYRSNNTNTKTTQLSKIQQHLNQTRKKIKAAL